MESVQFNTHQFLGSEVFSSFLPTASILVSLLHMISFLSLVPDSSPSRVLARTTVTLQGCYSSPGEDVFFDHRHVFQSIGSCMRACSSLEYHDDEADSQVIALTNATACFCGEPGKLPPTEDKVPMGECNLPCPGFAMETCGGKGYFQVYLVDEEEEEEGGDEKFGL